VPGLPNPLELFYIRLLRGGEASTPRMAEEQLTAPAFGQVAMSCKVLIG